MFFFGFSNNRIVSIFMLLTILVLSLALSAYLPVLEGLDGGAPTGGAPTGGAPTGGAPTGAVAAPTNAVPTGATDLNAIIAHINAQSKKPTETAEKQTINGIVLNDKFTEQTIDAAALTELLKNNPQIQAILNPTKIQ